MTKKKTADEVLSEMSAAQKTQIDTNTAQYQKSAQRIKQENETSLQKETDAAMEDHLAFAQKGVDADSDAASRLGLHRKLGETSKGRAYNAYRNRIAAAKRANQQSSEIMDYLLKQTQSEANASKKGIAANEKMYRYADAWKDKEWDYQLRADEKVEEANSAGYRYVDREGPISADYERILSLPVSQNLLALAVKTIEEGYDVDDVIEKMKEVERFPNIPESIIAAVTSELIRRYG